MAHELRFHKLVSVLTMTEHDEHGRVVNEHQGQPVTTYAADLDALPATIVAAIAKANGDAA